MKIDEKTLTEILDSLEEDIESCETTFSKRLEKYQKDNDLTAFSYNMNVEFARLRGFVSGLKLGLLNKASSEEEA